MKILTNTILLFAKKKFRKQFRNSFPFISTHSYTPNKVAKPLSTPEKPMNAMANKPAVTKAIAIPSIPFGMFTKLNCSRIPANNTIAKAKPIAVAKA